MTDDPQSPNDEINCIIEEAEDANDPFKDLVQKTAADPSAPFDPATLKRLASLQVVDLRAFEQLRAKLKGNGCRLKALDDAIAGESDNTAQSKARQADVLIGFASEAELFHSSDSVAYADIQVKNHRQTWPIRSKPFKYWLLHRYYGSTGEAPNSEALQSALAILEAKALYDGVERKVYLRVASFDGKLYLDLADSEWRAVEVDANGWRVIDAPPVRFRRTTGMLPLPEPVRGGSVDAIRPFLNLKNETDFVLATAWALAALRSIGPYPVLVLSGEQGSAKSTFTKILKSLLDPNTAPIRSLPQDDRNFFIAATNGHVLAFDNASMLKPWLSDTMCRLATGGGFAHRQLYTDQEEVLFTATRPQILNGIEDFVTRPDLADRSLLLTLEAISEEKRRPEAELCAQFELECPLILGALLNATVEGLKNLPHTALPALPRMADFALWAIACEPALWPSGTFWKAYSGNLDAAVETVLEADSVATAVQRLMVEKTDWKGTATELKDTLEAIMGEKVTRAREWPANARGLSGRLRRAAPLLRKAGISIVFEKGKTRERTRHVLISTTEDRSGAEKTAATSSKPSVPSETPAGAAVSETRFAHAEQVLDYSKGRGSANGERSVRAPSIENDKTDDVDGVDAKISKESGGSSTTQDWRARI
jgi:hypothetical protein